MKKTTALFILFSVIVKLNAQFSERNAIYATGELGLGNYMELNLNLIYVFNEKYSIQAGCSTHGRVSKSQPSDYSSGLVGIFTLGLAQLHWDQMDNYQILIGRIYKGNENGTIRFNLECGLGYTVITEPTN